MDNCIFCKIIKGEISSVKIWEDNNFLAILDLFPNRKGITLVIPKKHFNSDVFKMPDQELKKYIIATKKVINILKKGLKVDKIGMILEGLEVDHAHLRLYPFYKNNMGFKKGFQSGPQANINELEKIAKEIQNNQ